MTNGQRISEKAALQERFFTKDNAFACVAQRQNVSELSLSHARPAADG